MCSSSSHRSRSAGRKRSSDCRRGTRPEVIRGRMEWLSATDAHVNSLPLSLQTMTSPGVRLRRVAALSVLTASILSGLGCSDDPASPAEQEITIGGLFSLTGNWASLGVASKAAMEIGIEDVNAYVAEGNSGLRFTASIKDTKLEPATALTEVTAFRNAGIEVVIGPQSSAEVAAIKAYVDANGVLVASQSSTAGSLAIANDNIFRFTPSDTLEAVALV